MWTGIKSQIPVGAVIKSVEFEIPFDQSLTTQATIEFRYYNPQGRNWPIDKWEHMGPEGAEPVVATLPANTGTFKYPGLCFQNPSDNRWWVGLFWDRNQKLG